MARERKNPTPTTLTVLRSETVSAHMVRVVLGGTGFDTFAPRSETDSYVKLEIPSEDGPVVRTYTVRRVDPAAREIWIDFVVHGDQGVAGPWAQTVTPGTDVAVRGPGGGYRPDPEADFHLLAGDETAVPAISAALESLPSDSVGAVFLEVWDDDDEVALTAPAGVQITWLHRGASSADVGHGVIDGDAPLVTAVREMPWPDGDVQVFVHGEAETVMKHLRPFLRSERGVPAGRASISGYWRRGRTEEGFRTWKRELAESEPDQQPVR
ncbi:NADPH-dependent ferric siderophore reductase [Dietzia psychralcaliphila]|uniref:NADPH-dependent ferric siderophore reductase n=2 Tax=Dietzia psychralcaliphila TaxID=139021 RepID=A0AAD0JUE9_9ACTN|nr:siderophore-interacting protein [Dietzia psychralcaliphila]AWH96857.1 NADPH-dependent ferric siderophore reductase [Dietzia psychralcaliphila]PTM89513.1 NADPH-dependent ferric siderophore reductase [Dietzia psychralcaliphila]